MVYQTPSEQLSLDFVLLTMKKGITATHSLPFEVKAPTHARFKKDEAVNRWSMSPRTLRQLMEHFGTGTELLDIHADGEGFMKFACYSQKQYVKAEGEFVGSCRWRVAADSPRVSRLPQQAAAYPCLYLDLFKPV